MSCSTCVQCNAMAGTAEPWLCMRNAEYEMGRRMHAKLAPAYTNECAATAVIALLPAPGQHMRVHPRGWVGGSPMGRVTLRHLTPGMVSTSRGWLCWASWKHLMLLYATSKASLLSLLSSGSGKLCNTRVSATILEIGWQLFPEDVKSIHRQHWSPDA